MGEIQMNSNLENHRQVPANCRGEEILVDEGLKDVLEKMWSAGFDTLWSCQGGEFHYNPPGYRHYGDGYILFASGVNMMDAVDCVGWKKPGLFWIDKSDFHNSWTIRFPAIEEMTRELPDWS